MIKLNHSQLIGFLILCSILLLANTSNPPNGRTGAPGDSTCASGCHTGINSSLDGDMTIEGIPFSIQANTTYTLTVTVDNPNGAGDKGGFQMVALNINNQNAGSMSNSDANSTTTTSGGRTYHEHSPAQNFNGGNEAVYTVDWTAPAGPDGDLIIFYGCAVISNGAGGNSGDRVVFGFAEGELAASSTPPGINVSLINNVLCFDGDDGSAIATATGGTPGYDYLWDNGENTATAFNLTSGTHTVTVTDDAMNTAVGMIMITEPTAMIPAVVTTTNEDCSAQNGAGEITGTGGTPTYTYLWPDGSTNAINAGLSTGDYLTTVTDANMCSETIMVIIGNNPSSVNINMINMSSPSCVGDSDGTITVNGSNGTAPYSYLWSNGENMPTATDLSAGTYTVTVSDNLGCSAMQSYTLSDPTALNLSISGTNLNCFNDASGAAQTIVSGGAGSYMYLWSDGSTSGSINNLAAGTYYCTLTDANACETIDSIIITEPAVLNPNLSSTSTVSGGATGTASTIPSGGTSPYTIMWSNGSTTNTITGLPVGTYSVTITDDQDCIAINSITVVDTDCNLTSTFTSNSITCNGAMNGSINVSPTGGTGILTYNWSSGQSTEDLSNLNAGIYAVTITDTDMCSFEIDNIEIIEPTELSLTPEVISIPGCNGQEFGMITVNVSGGNAPYMYQWASGFMSDTINIASGMYPVTITDANNCMESTVVDVISTDTTPPIISVQDITVYVDPTGMTPTITSAMFDNGSTDDCQIDEFIFDNSSLDCSDRTVELMIELVDINNNASFDTIQVTVLDTLSPIIQCPTDISQSVCSPSNYTLPTATDNCDVDVVLVSGPAPGDQLPIGVSQVIYEATDEFNNRSTCSFTITVDPQIDYSFETTDVSCFNFQDGTFSLAVSVLNEPFSYSSNAVDSMFLEAGDYFFTLTDDTGCTVMDTFVISEPPILLISDFEITNSTNSNSGDGAITITPTGGVPGYTYEWFLNGMPISTDQNLSNLAPGIYTCIVEDASGCTYESIDFEVEATVATLDIDLANAFKIYPNPAENTLFISQNAPYNSIASYKLMDMQGKVQHVIDRATMGESIDVSAYNKGIYLLEIVSQGTRFYQKVLIL